MKEAIKRELSIGAQYFLILCLTVVFAYVIETTHSNGGSSGETAQAINMYEEWKLYQPYIIQVIKVFFIFALIRFAVVYVQLYYQKRQSGVK